MYIDISSSVYSVSINLYKVTGQFPWSSLRETDRGVSAEMSVNTLMCSLFHFHRCSLGYKLNEMSVIYPQFPVWKTNQTLKWEGVWRELGCLARSASFAVREESGHSLKSSLSVLAIDFMLVVEHCVTLSDWRTADSFQSC